MENIFRDYFFRDNRAEPIPLEEDIINDFSPEEERFILDRNLNIKINSYVVKSAKKINTYIFYNKKNFNKQKNLKKFGVKLLKCKLNSDNKIDLKHVLIQIKKIGINYLLVEGGNKLTESFIVNNLFNEF